MLNNWIFYLKKKNKKKNQLKATKKDQKLKLHSPCQLKRFNYSSTVVHRTVYTAMNENENSVLKSEDFQMRKICAVILLSGLLQYIQALSRKCLNKNSQSIKRALV